MLQTLTRSIMKSTDGFINEDVAQEYARKIFDDYKKYDTSDPDMPSEIFDDPDMEEYLGMGIEVFMREKVDMTNDELRALTDSGKIGGEEFNNARGYTPEETQQFQIFSEMGEYLDPNNDYLVPINHHLEELRSSFNKFKPLNRRPDEPRAEPVQLSPERREQVDSLVSNLIIQNNPISRSLLSSEGANRIGRYLVDSISEDPEFQKILKDINEKFPKVSETSRPDLPPVSKSLIERKDAQRQVDMTRTQFTRESQWKRPVYRATDNYTNMDSDVAAALPREMGIHVGTSPTQAETVVVSKMDPDNFSKFTRGAPESQEQIDDYFKGFMERYETQQAKGVPDDESPMEMRPFMISKGYIDVRNPIRLKDDASGWFVGKSMQNVKAYEELITAVKKQMDRDLTKKELKKIEEIKNQATRYYRGRKDRWSSLPKVDQELEMTDPLINLSDHYIMTNQGEFLDKVKDELMSVKLNQDLQEWLKDLGFDSIVYENVVEGSLPKASKDSYILFDNNQFKTAWNRTFDRNDPRHNYNSGGLVKAINDKKER